MLNPIFTAPSHWSAGGPIGTLLPLGSSVVECVEWSTERVSYPGDQSEVSLFSDTQGWERTLYVSCFALQA